MKPSEEQLPQFMHADTRLAYLGESAEEQKQQLREAEVVKWKQANCSFDQ